MGENPLVTNFIKKDKIKKSIKKGLGFAFLRVYNLDINILYSIYANFLKEWRMSKWIEKKYLKNL